MHAALSTPNGRRLYLEVGIKAHADQAGHRAVFFCEACFMALLQLFGQIGEANRVTLQ